MTSEVGNLGEKLVIDWLRANAYRILHHSWGCRWGELDIVALDSRDLTLAFVEVKTRSSSNWDQDGLLAISKSKQEKMIRSATLFIAKNNCYADFYMRFDVALVRYAKDSGGGKLKQESKVASQFLANPSLVQSARSSLFSKSMSNYQFHLLEYLVNAFDSL